MSADDLQRIAAFRASFARRQAAEMAEIPGGVVVLDPQFAASREHNQLVIDAAPSVSGLPALADAALGHLDHRRITVLDDAVGAACAPVLIAAGYAHETELVMTHSSAVALPGPLAQPVGLADLLPAVVRQLRSWMPDAGEAVVRQLAERRIARLRGAEKVCFLAVRDPSGTICSWADFYLDPVQGIAQIEDLVTADSHARRGYADAVLATALHRAADFGLFFLLADPGDWPHTWYARRGFTPIGRFHVFTRTEYRG